MMFKNYLDVTWMCFQVIYAIRGKQAVTEITSNSYRKQRLRYMNDLNSPYQFTA